MRSLPALHAEPLPRPASRCPQFCRTEAILLPCFRSVPGVNVPHLDDEGMPFSYAETGDHETASGTRADGGRCSSGLFRSAWGVLAMATVRIAGHRISSLERSARSESPSGKSCGETTPTRMPSQIQVPFWLHVTSSIRGNMCGPNPPLNVRHSQVRLCLSSF